MNQHILNKYNHENSRKIQKIYNKKKKRRKEILRESSSVCDIMKRQCFEL